VANWPERDIVRESRLRKASGASLKTVSNPNGLPVQFKQLLAGPIGGRIHRRRHRKAKPVFLPTRRSGMVGVRASDRSPSLWVLTGFEEPAVPTSRSRLLSTKRQKPSSAADEACIGALIAPAVIFFATSGPLEISGWRFSKP
jgi:hypothetical protein